MLPWRPSSACTGDGHSLRHDPASALPAIIGVDGRVHRLHAYSVYLTAHTYGRNRNRVALFCACMGGIPDPWTQPPTPAQIISLCTEAAPIARGCAWQEGDISFQALMTHAEAVSNSDGRVMHDNYGPMIWGGSGELWDLLQLEQNGPSDGGEHLRQRICALLRGDPSPTPPSPLVFKGKTVIQAPGGRSGGTDRCAGPFLGARR